MSMYLFAQLLGLLSFVLGVLCFYQINDHRLKVMMVIMNINHALHFALLGAMTACLSAALSALRTGLSVKYSSSALGYVFILLAISGGAFIYESWQDVLPIFGTCIGTYALFNLEAIKLRLAFLVGAMCWLANNIIVGSIGGILLEATLIAVNLTTIYRLYLDSLD